MPPRKIDLLVAAEGRIAHCWDPHVAADVGGAQVKLAKFGPAFDWHAHPDEDEAFLVIRGRIAIDFRDGTVELHENQFILVPRATEHRPRALTHEPVVLMFEPATTLNTGDADSGLTVRDLKRL